MTLNDLERQLIAVLSEFDDETKGNRFEFQAHFPIGLHPKLN